MESEYFIPLLVAIPNRCRVSCPITDKMGRVIAALCGHPDDPTWESNHLEAAALMRQAQRRIRRTKKNSKHRRGHFTALAAGVSFGGGQKVNKPSHGFPTHY
jgi:hypothetical protein